MKRVLPSLIAVSVFAVIFRHFNFPYLIRLLGQSRWPLFGCAVILGSFLLPFFRAKRFESLMSSLPGAHSEIKLKDMVSITMATRALNLVLPGRAGETLRTMKITRRFGYPFKSVIAAVLTESGLEVITLTLMGSFIFSLGYFKSARHQLIYPMWGGAAIWLSLPLIARLNWSRLKTPQWIEEMKQAFHILSHFKTWARAIFWTFCGDFVDMAMVGLCLSAVGLSRSFPAWVLTLVVINIAIMIPTPANLGTLEAGAVIALGFLDIPREQALAFALIYHSAHVIPVLIIGCASLRAEFSTSSPVVIKSQSFKSLSLTPPPL